MAELTQADMMWNRACAGGRLRDLPGDRALANMLLAHGLIMNGGMLHAVERLGGSELTDAKAGYCFYGFHGVASLLSRARTLFESGHDLDDHERQLDAEYAAIISADSSLVERFETHLKLNPSAYAALPAKDMA